uniref:Uncharacterized protein n=1 Tax=Symphyocladiella dendroidea TaxID=2506487 RepID=A0A1Z1M7C0_9FLOR|nr:hypothetical protein [Symphyocladiella dendroidea]ARW61850.1 hypothetical protein [Symphyocladiella dendroidea]
MVSNLKNIYHEKYDDIDINDSLTNNEDIEENINMPTGWSFICLDETISYYTEHIHKTSDSMH